MLAVEELFRNTELEPKPHDSPAVDVLAPVLTAVLNAAFQVGVIPIEVNGGLVTPVFKKGDPFCTDN